MDLRVAISHAMDFARTALSYEKLSVEEVEYEDAPPAWRITVGYKRALPEKRRAVAVGSAAQAATISDRLSPAYIEYEDVYKTIVVPEDGGPLSMKIRKI